MGKKKTNGNTRQEDSTSENKKLLQKIIEKSAEFLQSFQKSALDQKYTEVCRAEKYTEVCRAEKIYAKQRDILNRTAGDLYALCTLTPNDAAVSLPTYKASVKCNYTILKVCMDEEMKKEYTCVDHDKRELEEAIKRYKNHPVYGLENLVYVPGKNGKKKNVKKTPEYKICAWLERSVKEIEKCQDIKGIIGMRKNIADDFNKNVCPFEDLPETEKRIIGFLGQWRTTSKQKTGKQ